jgi:hypothetical protein
VSPIPRCSFDTLRKLSLAHNRIGNGAADDLLNAFAQNIHQASPSVSTFDHL